MKRRTALLVLWAVACGAVNADAGNVAAGKGSYTLTLPEGVKLPPRTIYQTARVTGKMPTNDWWSSVAWERYSSNQFPHPLAVRAVEGGLRVSYPGLELHATPKHVFASMKNELTLGHSAVERFPDARVDGFSDWFVDVMFAGGDATMRVSYGHGSPFVYATFEGGGAVIRFDADANVWAGDANTPTLGVTVNRRHYGLFGPAGSTWAGLGGRTFTNRNGGKAHFSLAILPDATPAVLKLFARYAHRHVTGTQIEWRYVREKSVVETTFAFQTTAREGAGTGTLFALYPHQAAATGHKLLPHAYASIRGPMPLAEGRGFTTAMRFPGVLPALPDRGRYDRARLRGAIQAAAGKRLESRADTYWDGKALGTLTNLIPIAEQVGPEPVAAGLRTELKKRLETWLTAPGGTRRKERYFFYDETWGALIGQRPSYGSAEQLNDHHFHYGYFVRAAAELARADPAWAAPDAWGTMIDLLIRDMASPGRNDPLFPFLRCFDPYAGHSWASGHARFGDGNNQESCSEAMNAWTGVILWGEATGNRALRDLGIFLYTTELHAIQDYWFDVDDRLFPQGYEPTCAALIWGGKTDYATWFSGEPEHVHGIILLPIQPGSLYLGLRPEYVRRNLQGLAALRGGDKWRHWHDTLWAYEALWDAGKARGRFDAQPGLIGVHARPFVDHWIGTLQQLGHVDRTVTADHPTAMTFTRDGARTHVAYNMTRRPITVRFSDGAALDVQPGRCSMKP